MEMNLYEISNLYQNFMDAVEAGEIPEEAIADTLDGIEGLFEDKADNLACLIKSLSAGAAAIRAEEVALAERRRAKEVHCERLKAYLSTALKAAGKEKLETARNKLSFRKSVSVHIVDVARVLDNVAYLKPRKFDESEVDKTAVKAALVDGLEVPGAELLTKMNLQVK